MKINWIEAGIQGDGGFSLVENCGSQFLWEMQCTFFLLGTITVILFLLGDL